MKKHISMSIERALTFTDEELEQLFEGNVKNIRQELTERKQRCEKLIGCDDCVGFDAVNGCPGHEN